MRQPKPVTRIEVPHKHTGLRIAVVILLVVAAAVSITVGIMSLLDQETGWQRVQITPQKRSCSDSFLLQYHFKGSQADANAVNSKLRGVYEQATVKAYELFTPDESIEGVHNIHYINRHPNEEIIVDPVLYAAFEKLVETPYLYLGPAYGYYTGLIYNTDEVLLPDSDPATSAEARALVQRIADFAADRQAVTLELLGDGRIVLRVSDEYLSFLQEQELFNILDFGCMTNAFIIDYLADTLTQHGLTDGVLVSADGYTRNLTAGEQFAFGIFDRVEDTVYPAGLMTYSGPISLVWLKDHPMVDAAANYRSAGDHFLHLYTDPSDGMYRTADANLVSYSRDLGCADVLLRMLPGFAGETFALPEGVSSVWCEDGLICCNDASAVFTDLLESEEMTYRVAIRPEA